jgi:hypothetical protein
MVVVKYNPDLKVLTLLLTSVVPQVKVLVIVK